MNNNINFLDYKNKVITRRGNTKEKLLRKIALILLFTISSLSVVLFILITLSPLPELAKQRKAASFNLSLADKDIGKLILVKERSDKIQQIIEKRNNYNEDLENFQNILPQGVTIESVSMNQRKMSVELTSNSLRPFNTILDQFANNDKSQEYSKITMTGLRMNPDKGSFNITFSIDLL